MTGLIIAQDDVDHSSLISMIRRAFTHSTHPLLLPVIVQDQFLADAQTVNGNVCVDLESIRDRFGFSWEREVDTTYGSGFSFPKKYRMLHDALLQQHAVLSVGYGAVAYDLARANVEALQDIKKLYDGLGSASKRNDEYVEMLEFVKNRQAMALAALRESKVLASSVDTYLQVVSLLDILRSH